MCHYFGQQEFFQRFFAGHSRLMGRQYLPMLSSLPGFVIGMIIDFSHISVICPVEIVSLLVGWLMAS